MTGDRKARMWKVYRDGSLVASCRHASDAALLVASAGGHVHHRRKAVWREGMEEFSAKDDCVGAASVMVQRAEELMPLPPFRPSAETWDRLRRVREATTTNFVELARITGLDAATDFRGGDFQGFCFDGADLTGFDFSNATMRGATFRGARVEGAKFTGAELDDGAFDVVVGSRPLA